MYARHVTLACAMVFGFIAAAHAAPLQALAPSDNGEVTVSGLTGEIYISVPGPPLQRSNALDIPGATKEIIFAGEVSYLDLHGFSGSLSMGPVISPHQTAAAYAHLRLTYQPPFGIGPILLPQIVPLGF